MTATCVVQLPATHPLLPQLQLAAANAANALLHTALMQQQDAALLQLLIDSHELNQLMVQLAAAALGDSSSSSNGANVHQLPAVTKADQELLQLVCIVIEQLNLKSSSSGGSGMERGSSDAGSPAAAAAAAGVIPSVLPECQLAAALIWHQHQVVLFLTALLPGQATAHGHTSSSSSALLLPVERAFRQDSSSTLRQLQAAAAQTAQATGSTQQLEDELAAYGLSVVHLLALSQSCGGGLLQLLLLDSVRLLLLLLQRTAQQHSGTDSISSGRQQRWHWKELHVVLQNAVAAAAGSSSSSLQAEAAIGCLAGLYAAAAADVHAAAVAAAEASDAGIEDDHSNAAATAAMVAESSSAYAVACSAWNKHILQDCLQRLCQRAIALRVACQQALQAAASSSRSTQPAGFCSWLCDADCQQQCQAWCYDAHLLLNYMQLISTASGGQGLAGTAAAAADASNSRSSGGLRSGLQQLLQAVLEQQQLLQFLCWAAARSSWVDDFVNSSGGGGSSSVMDQRYLGYDGYSHHSLAEQSWQQQQDQLGGYSHRQQQQQNMPAAAAAAALLQLQLSRLSLQLLAALLQSGCLNRQLPWLQQQLQQQMWAVSQQQQQASHNSAVYTTTTAAADIVGAMLAAGGLQALSAIEVVDGLAVGLLRPCEIELMMMSVEDAGDSIVLRVAECQELLAVVGDAIKQQQQQQ
jgi:hypothetical protein